MGQQSEVMDPTGDITQTNYNALGLVTSVYVGTSDGTTWPGGFSGAASKWRKSPRISTTSARAAATAC